MLKKGCTFEELCEKFLELKKRLSSNFQIGFNSETIEEAVMYSLKLLSDDLIVKNSNKIAKKQK